MELADIVNIVIVENNLVIALRAWHRYIIELVLDEGILGLVNSVVIDLVRKILKGL